MAKRIIVSMIAGLIFGIGLTMSQMVNPAVVRGFLDFAGEWNPSLMFVLGGAVGVSLLNWKLRSSKSAPILGGEFPGAPSSVIDRKLITGAILFGLGWGLVGICPGPAIVGLTIGGMNSLIFVLSMLSGFYLFSLYSRA